MRKVKSMSLIVVFNLILTIFFMKTLQSICRTKIQGGYKECVEYHFSYKSNEIDSNTKEMRHLYKYDTSGNMIEEQWFSCLLITSNKNLKQDSVIFRRIFKYDNHDNEIEVIKFENGNTLDFKIISKYDYNGKMIQKHCLDSDGQVLWKSNFIYNSEGYLEEELTDGDDYPYENKIKYKYDKDGNNIEEIGFRVENEDSICYQYKYKYDIYKNLIEWFGVSKNMEFLFHTKYHYNENNILIEQVNLNNFNQVNNKIIYIYDEKQNIIEELNLLADDSLYERKTYKYDEDSNCIETVLFNEKKIPVDKTVYIFKK